MYFLRHYSDFSAKYKIIGGSSLNQGLKLYIGKKYKELIAEKVIENFLTKNIKKCRDCGKHNWNITNGIYQKFYFVDACNNTNYYSDVNCCIKYICYKDCRFIINCKFCNNSIKYIPVRKNSDIGWNPIEGEKRLNIKCENCNKNNLVNLAWNNNYHDDTTLGKLI